MTSPPNQSGHFANKEQTYFWNCWKFESSNGQSRWNFEIPTELKDIVLNDADWDKPEAQDFLYHFDQAFVFDKNINPNSGDRVFRWIRAQEKNGHKLWQSEGDSLHDQVHNALLNGFSYYETLQEPDGNWAGDYGGPLFLIPGLVIASHITGAPFERPMPVSYTHLTLPTTSRV